MQSVGVEAGMDPFGSRTWKPILQDSLFSMGFRPKGFFLPDSRVGNSCIFYNKDISTRQNGVPNAGLEGSGQAHSRRLRQKMKDLVHATKSINVITYTRRTQHHRYKCPYLTYKGMFFWWPFLPAPLFGGPFECHPIPNFEFLECKSWCRSRSPNI